MQQSWSSFVKVTRYLISKVTWQLSANVFKGLSVTGKHGDKINQFVQFEITYVNPAVQINVSVDEIVLSHDNKNIRLSWTESAVSAVQG